MTNNCVKTKFRDEKTALLYLKKIKATSTRTKIPERAYLCPICMTWHLTSTEDETLTAKYKKEIDMLGRIIQTKQAKIMQQKAKLQEYDLIIKQLKNRRNNPKPKRK